MVFMITAAGLWYKFTVSRLDNPLTKDEQNWLWKVQELIPQSKVAL